MEIFPYYITVSICCSLRQTMQYRVEYLVVRGTEEQVQKCLLKALAESWSKVVFLWSKLMPGLPHDGVHHVQPGNFVFRGTLKP